MAETAIPAVEPVAPAATAVEPTPAPVLQPTTPQERHEWRLKGPQGPPKETAEVPAVPATEAEKPKSGKKLTLAEREKQVDDRTADAQARLREKIRIQREIEAQLDDRAPKVTKPAEETKKAARDRFMALPDAPKLEQFENYEDYSAELAVFIGEKIADEREAKRAQSQTQQTRQQAMDARLNGFKDRYGKVDAETLAVIEASDLMVPDDPNGPIGYVLTDSPVGPYLMRYFVEHPDQLQRIAGLGDPNDQYAEMKRIEGYVQALREQAPSTPVIASRVVDSRPTSPAPPEPVTLGRKPGSPVDELKAAWERGDTRTARRLQLEKDRGSVTTR